MTTISFFKLTIISTLIAMTSTILGASCILCIKDDLNLKYYKLFLGFTSGIMISSSIWSLLIPATELSSTKLNSLIGISIGFILGTVCFKLIDKFISSLIMKGNLPIPLKSKKNSLIVLSAALRNLIEGISIGIAFSLSNDGNLGSLAGAIALSGSMALQNFPEGFAIAIPFKNQETSKYKAVMFGSIPGFLEPIGGIIGVFLASKLIFALPTILAFAAGSVITTVVDEIIPEYNLNSDKNYGTIGFALGFLLLLMLDIILK